MENKGIRLRILPSITDDLLKEVTQIFKQHEDFTDEALLTLHSLFGNPLERALQLLETNCIVYLRSPRGRYVIQVTGSSGIPYTLFPGVNYCSCLAYRYQVIGSQTFLTCKHVLAGCLAEIMRKGRDLSVSAEELANVLSAAANLDGDSTTHNGVTKLSELVS